MTLGMIVGAFALLGTLAASAGATEPDKTPPVVTLSGTAVKAVEEGGITGTYELHIVAADGSKAAPQSGISKIEVGVDGSGQQSWEKSCPEGSCGLEEKWTYSPATYLFESPRWITVVVTDHAGNVTEEEISIEGLEEIREAAPTGPDATPPTITLLGSAVEAIETGATSGKYELRMLARDGSPSAPQSGISKIEVAVDGTTVQSWEKYCPVGSCRLKIQWPWNPASFTGTGHVVTVTVRDHAGNVTTRTIRPDTIPPVVELSGALTEGIKTGTTSYPLHVHATDGSPEFPGSGVKSITISVDGTVVKSGEQGCPTGDCELNLEWIYETSKYPCEHEVAVATVDRAGNPTTRILALAIPDGPIPACNPLGGSTAEPPSETSSLPGGGTLYTYKTASGEKYEFPVPAESFHPTTASAAELEEYSYPPRPAASGKAALAAWEAATSGGSAHGMCVDATGTDHELSEAGEGPGPGVKTFPDYSGYQAFTAAGEALFTAVTGRFVQAKGEPKTCKKDADNSWVGFGGEGSGLDQIGTATSEEGQPHAFWNAISEGSVRGNNPDHRLPVTIHAGDEVTMTIWRKSTGYPGFFVSNGRGGPESHVGFHGGKTAKEAFDQTVIDFIDERPTHTSGPEKAESFHLYDFGEMNWKEADVRRAGSSAELGLSEILLRRRVRMEEKEKLLAVPESLRPGGEGFLDRWYHCAGGE